MKPSGANNAKASDNLPQEEDSDEEYDEEDEEEEEEQENMHVI